MIRLVILTYTEKRYLTMKKNDLSIPALALTLLLSAILVIPVYAQDQPMRSREIIDNGTFVEVTGNLRHMGGEWFLAVDQVLHQLYTAPPELRQEWGVPLEEQKHASVTGFFYSPDGDPAGVIAVSTITIDSKQYRFREDDGTPRWRGRGAGTTPGDGTRSGRGPGS